MFQKSFYLTTKGTKDVTKAHKVIDYQKGTFVFLCEILCVPLWLNTFKTSPGDRVIKTREHSKDKSSLTCRY